MPFASQESRLAAALFGLLLVLVGEIERSAPWSAWLAPLGLACTLAMLVLSLRAGTRAARRRIAVVGILAGGAAVHDAQLGPTEVGGAVVLAASVTVGWRHRASRRRARPANYRVTDGMLRERFATLGQGKGGARWDEFLAQRAPGDELWYVYDDPTDPEEDAWPEALVLRRSPASQDAAEPAGERVAHEVARYPVRTD